MYQTSWVKIIDNLTHRTDTGTGTAGIAGLDELKPRNRCFLDQLGSLKYLYFIKGSSLPAGRQGFK
jgi:hypothetical protein